MHTGYVVPSAMVIRMASLFSSRQAQEQAPALSYTRLYDIAQGMYKTAFQAPEELAEKRKLYEERVEREKRKEKKQRGGDKRLTEGFAEVLQDILEDYTPLMFFENNKESKKALEDFYRYSYKAMGDRFPKRFAAILRHQRLANLSAQDVGTFNPEMVNRLVTDMLVYYREHPEKIRNSIVRAASSAHAEEDGGRRLSVGQAFFVPGLDTEQYNALLKSYEEAKDRAIKENTSPPKPPKNIDKKLLENLEGKKGEEIVWENHGFDDNKVLHFTLPEFTGNKIHRIKMPADVQNIRSGTYHFKVVRVAPTGAVLQFVEQRKDMAQDVLKRVSNEGLAPDQVRLIPDQMVNGFLDYYVPTEMSKERLAQLIEDLGGTLKLKGSAINSLEDFEEAASTIKQEGRGRGKKLLEEIEKTKEKQQDAVKLMSKTWSDKLVNFFMNQGKVESEEGQSIIRAISSRYPENMEGAPSLPNLLKTRPAIEKLLTLMLSGEVPGAGGGKVTPWIPQAIELMKTEVMQDPALNESFKDIIRAEKLKTQGKTPAQVGAQVPLQKALTNQEPIEVTDQEVQTVLSKITADTWRKNLNRLKEDLGKVIESMKGSPAMHRFFDRVRTWRSYLQKQIEDGVSVALTKMENSPEEAEAFLKTNEGEKLVEKVTKDVQRKTQYLLTKEASELNSFVVKTVMTKMGFSNISRGC